MSVSSTNVHHEKVVVASLRDHLYRYKVFKFTEFLRAGKKKNVNGLKTGHKAQVYYKGMHT